MRFPGEEEGFGVGSSAPEGEDDVDDPEADKWGEEFEEVVKDFRHFTESG
jgi:hypothetical protein